MTGLPNRTLFNDRLEQALLLSARENHSGIIAFIDLDNFKEINDTYGHAAGDELIKIIAGRLTLCVRGSDTVARMNGDEFLIIFQKVAGDEHVTTLAQQLLNTISKPVVLQGAQITPLASIGLCYFPEHGNSVDELLRCADNAMYKVKHEGRNSFHLVGSNKQTADKDIEGDF